MGELVPSVLLYGQAVGLLEDLKDAQEGGYIKDTFDLIYKLAEILTRFQDNAGRPLLNYEPVVEHEPPNSDKSNRFWAAAEKDITLLQQQVDILRAAAVFSHNMISTEVLEARNQNARVGNKLKTLQLYSNAFDEDIVTFGDVFRSLDFVDLDMVPPSSRASLPHEGNVTLAEIGDMTNLSKDASIKVLDISNGFLGNNQELEDTASSGQLLGTNTQDLVFKAELRNYSDLLNITDENPQTWIEYESNQLTSAQKRSALNYNFEYKRTNEDDDTTELVDWAEAPPDGVLRLGLEFDIGKIRNLNVVEFTPYGLEDNANYPVVVRHIQTSPNGTDWTRLFPSNVWVGTDINLRAARTADHVVTQKAMWAFGSRAVRYVRVYIEQHHPVSARVGHVYWVDRETEKRVKGPNPPIENPTKYYDKFLVGTARQERELFPGKRWVIGIRDLLLKRVEYAEKSILVTKPLRVGGDIDRVMLDRVEVDIPPEYPDDESWVRFYISPDEGENWHPIAPIQDNFSNIPEQISFNDPLPASLREGSVFNYNTDRAVTSLRLKVELSRPPDLRGTTPVLRSYSLKVRRR